MVVLPEMTYEAKEEVWILSLSGYNNPLAKPAPTRISMTPTMI